MDREDWIEEVCEANAVRFGDKAIERAVAVEAPWPASFDNLEARLVVPVEDLVRHAAVRPAIHEGQRVRAVPGNADDGDHRVWQDAADSGIRLEVFELQECSALQGSVVSMRRFSSPEFFVGVLMQASHLT